jgi:hypothetical protein
MIEKNLVLLLGRFCTIADTFDNSPLADKVDCCVNYVKDLAEAAHSHEEHEKSHAKKQKKPHSVPRQGIEDCKAVIRKLQEILLPDGLQSLLLPSGSHMFMDWLVDVPELILESFARWLHDTFCTYNQKLSFVFALYFSLYEALRNQVPFPRVHIEIPEELQQETEGAVIPLAKLLMPPSLSRFSDFLPKAEIAKIVIEAIAGSLLGLAIQKKTTDCVVAVVEKGFSCSHTKQELEHLIGLISRDRQTVAFLIKNIISCKTEEAHVKKQTFFSLLKFGFQTSAIDRVVDDMLGSVPWQEEAEVVLERVFWFFMSPEFEAATLRHFTLSLERYGKVHRSK